MNIHFTDEKLFEDLMESAIFKVKFGSHVYGLNNKKSDEDIMIIYAEPYVNSQSFFRTYHQLQYKKNNVDYIFLTLQQFITNCLSGDSTINFEVLHSKKFKESDLLSKFYKKREIFYNYNICKSYLGFAKRDLKMLRKEKEYSSKKVSHFIRGILTAEAILTGKKVEEYVYKEKLTLLKNIKNTNSSSYEDFKEIIEFYETLMNDLREKLNISLNNRKIIKIISGDNAKELNNIVFNIIKSLDYISSQKEYINFGDLNEQGHFEEKFNY